jgi:group I intron endonuclease
MYHVYVITDLNTGNYYVGSTGEIDKRLTRHENELRSGRHHNLILQQLFDAGHDLRVSTYEFTTREEAYANEDHLINRGQMNRLCINIGSSAIGGDNLTRNPNREEIISRIGESVRTRNESLGEDGRRAAYGRTGQQNGMFGRSHSDESKRLMSEANLGNSYAKGSIRSEDQRRLLSTFASTRTGRANPFYGKSHSEETRKKLSEARKGNVPPNTLSVIIDGVIYPSLAEAGRQLGIPVPTIHYRIKSNNPKYSGYELRETPND